MVAMCVCLGISAQWSKPTPPASVPMKTDEALYLYNPEADGFFLGANDIVLFQFAINYQLARGNIFTALFFFEPLTDFRTSLTRFCDFYPIAARPL